MTAVKRRIQVRVTAVAVNAILSVTVIYSTLIVCHSMTPLESPVNRKLVQVLFAGLCLLLLAIGVFTVLEGSEQASTSAVSPNEPELVSSDEVVGLDQLEIRSKQPEPEPMAELATSKPAAVNDLDRDLTKQSTDVDEGPFEYKPAMLVGSELAETYANGLELRIADLEKAMESGHQPATAAVHVSSLAVAAQLSLEGRAMFVEPGMKVRLAPRYEGEYRFGGLDSSLFAFDKELEFHFFTKCLKLQAGEVFGESDGKASELQDALSEALEFGKATLKILGR